jgi:hypothetical protein
MGFRHVRCARCTANAPPPPPPNHPPAPFPVSCPLCLWQLFSRVCFTVCFYFALFRNLCTKLTLVIAGSYVECVALLPQVPSHILQSIFKRLCGFIHIPHVRRFSCCEAEQMP